MPASKKTGVNQKWRTSAKRVFRGLSGPERKTLKVIEFGITAREITQILAGVPTKQIGVRDNAISRMSIKYALDAVNVSAPETRQKIYRIFSKAIRQATTAQNNGKPTPEATNKFFVDATIRLLGQTRAMLFFSVLLKKDKTIRKKMNEIENTADIKVRLIKKP